MKKPEKKIWRIIIEFDGEAVRVNAEIKDGIMAFGMMKLAELELESRLKGHYDEKDSGKIIKLGKGPLPRVM